MSDLTGTRFDQWSLSDFAAQCKMQARDQLDPEYSAFMTALASALTTAESKLAEARADALEEAAKVAEAHFICDWSRLPGQATDNTFGRQIATAIRSMKFGDENG